MVNVNQQNSSMGMPTVQKKEGKGCFFYGCVTSIIALIIIVIAIYVGARYALNRVVEAYTVETRSIIPEVGTTTTDYGLIRERLGKFVESVKGGGARETALSLSADDINTLIKFDPDWAPLKDSVFVRIEGDKIKAQVSLDLKEFGYPGRFVNGSAVFAAKTDRRGPHIFLVDADFNGHKMPEEVAKKIADTDLLAEAERKNQGDLKAAIDAIGSLKIQNGALSLSVLSESEDKKADEEEPSSTNQHE